GYLLFSKSLLRKHFLQYGMRRIISRKNGIDFSKSSVDLVQLKIIFLVKPLGRQAWRPYFGLCERI
ncbi:MAG TPA: hypothetical protein PKD91_05395, partial [Bacteroidia bacterium]|nr:hypothetical protein [Bacteroidia bacterium]